MTFRLNANTKVGKSLPKSPESKRNSQDLPVSSRILQKQVLQSGRKAPSHNPVSTKEQVTHVHKGSGTWFTWSRSFAS